MTCHLVLIRHAETTWHVEQRFQGRADAPLTEDGQRQAMVLGSALGDHPWTSVHTSDLGRAVTTARLMGFPDAHRDAAWSEADFGDWTGRKHAEIRDAYEADFRAWRVGGYEPPGAEPWSEQCDRVATAALALGDGAHLVVTHGGVIRALLQTLVGLDLHTLAPLECAHGVAVRRQDGWTLAGYGLSPTSMLPPLVG